MKLITITSGKGGVGKTTTAINLGAALNFFEKEVIILDANLTTPNIGLHLGAPIVPVNLNHVLIEKAKISDAIYEHESGTKIIPSSLSVKELKRLNYSKLKEVGAKLKKMADYVIFDSAAGLGEEAKAAIEAADELILVTNPEIPAVTDALKTIKFAENLGKEVRGVIITRVRNSKNEMSPNNIRDMLETPLIGIVPEDKNVQSSVRHKDALVHVYPYSKASMAYKRIAARLADIDYKEPGLLKRLFGRN
ncbi:septum site-determining protein MinD [Candidatus Parvarchaeota archaeon]|jgi:septum site-determining protein MinD|nr:MAG: septum site-determining protein MinD [Candidatus Parvarchaeota archaeon]PXY71489.1 MAG: septum site-determining protein MinD [Candidatus Parvarchaeota archaeon]